MAKFEVDDFVKILLFGIVALVVLGFVMPKTGCKDPATYEPLLCKSPTTYNAVTKMCSDGTDPGMCSDGKEGTRVFDAGNLIGKETSIFTWVVIAAVALLGIYVIGRVQSGGFTRSTWFLLGAAAVALYFVSQAMCNLVDVCPLGTAEAIVQMIVP